MIFNGISKYWIVMLINVINFENSSKLFLVYTSPLVSSLSIPQNLMNTEFSTNIPASIEPPRIETFYYFDKEKLMDTLRVLI